MNPITNIAIDENGNLVEEDFDGNYHKIYGIERKPFYSGNDVGNHLLYSKKPRGYDFLPFAF